MMIVSKAVYIFTSLFCCEYYEDDASIPVDIKVSSSMYKQRMNLKNQLKEQQLLEPQGQASSKMLLKKSRETRISFDVSKDSFTDFRKPINSQAQKPELEKTVSQLTKSCSYDSFLSQDRDVVADVIDDSLSDSKQAIQPLHTSCDDTFLNFETQVGDEIFQSKTYTEISRRSFQASGGILYEQEKEEAFAGQEKEFSDQDLQELSQDLQKNLNKYHHTLNRYHKQGLRNEIITYSGTAAAAYVAYIAAKMLESEPLRNEQEYRSSIPGYDLLASIFPMLFSTLTGVLLWEQLRHHFCHRNEQVMQDVQADLENVKNKLTRTTALLAELQVSQGQLKGHVQVMIPTMDRIHVQVGRLAIKLAKEGESGPDSTVHQNSFDEESKESLNVLEGDFDFDQAIEQAEKELQDLSSTNRKKNKHYVFGGIFKHKKNAFRSLFRRP
mgnify:CR=1 FL=1